MNDRQQTDYNKLVGRDKDGTLIYLDYIFNHSDGFKGATGTRLEPISKDEYDERCSDDNVREYLRDTWQYQVSEGQTEQSLDEYVEEAIRYDGAEQIVFDSSYAYGA